MSRADQSNSDSIELPLVSLTRGQSISILSTNKKPLSYDGKKFNANSKKIQQLNGIPISINYQLDIYTRHRVENDDLWREFVFKIINNPKLFVEIPYKEEKIMHVFNMRITDTVEDNSDIPEHLISGEFFRSTLNIYVDDAYLFDYKVKDTLSLEVGVKPDKQEDIE